MMISKTIKPLLAILDGMTKNEIIGGTKVSLAVSYIYGIKHNL